MNYIYLLSVDIFFQLLIPFLAMFRPKSFADKAATVSDDNMIPDDMLPPSDDGDSDTEDLADLVVNMNRVHVHQLESESEESCTDEEESLDGEETNVRFANHAHTNEANADNYNGSCSINAIANSSVK